MMGVSTGLKPRRAIKIEKPRPLKLSSTMQTADHNLESVLGEMDLVTQALQSGVWDQRALYPSITSLCENLKMFGPQLENVYKDQVDKCYIWLRTGCRDDRLSLAARYRLLEIIELRAMNWKPNQNLISYYQTKLQHIEAEEAAMEEQTELAAYMTSPQANTMTAAAMVQAAAAAASMAVSTTPLHTPTTPSAPMFPHQHLQYQPYPQQTLMAAQPQTLLYGQYHQTPAGLIPVEHYQQQPMQPQHQIGAVVAAVPLLSPGEVVRTSGKFSKPTRIAGKNYCKDEVVIRNQDSGKVMGIKGRRVHMIEELSETIISFQRVAPGARERLVQITGPSEDNINQAKQLIEDTIRRNASPVREAHSLSSGGSSVFSSSPLNGSNSSIASHTDDDSNSLTGCKRNTLVHSMSMASGSDSGVCGGGDACMADYRYTVSHNNNAIRITGNNLTMVRTAKLVLDEYFNGDRNLNNIAQLLSADGSPPMLVKPATPPATPPPLSSSSTTNNSGITTDATDGAGEGNTNAVVGVVKGDESPKNGGVAIVRQPLFPSSSKDAIDVAEGNSSSSNGAKLRRSAFAKTSEERNSSSGDDDDVAIGGEVLLPRGYARQEMIGLATVAASRLTPTDWASVVNNNPELIKKVTTKNNSSELDKVTTKNNSSELDKVTSTVNNSSELKVTTVNNSSEFLDNSSEFMNKVTTVNNGSEYMNKVITVNNTPEVVREATDCPSCRLEQAWSCNNNSDDLSRYRHVLAEQFIRQKNLNPGTAWQLQ